MTDSDPTTQQLRTLRELIQSLAKDARPGYDSVASRMLQLQGVFRTEAAAALSEPLNTKLSEMPSETYEHKKRIAAFANAELRQFGLAVRCPRTGQPGVLQANPGGHSETGRFRIEVLDALGQRRHHTSAVELPELSLTIDTTSKVPHRVRGGRLK